MSLLPRMYEHMAWADDRTLTSLREMNDAPSQAMNLLAHILGAEHEWISRIHLRKASQAIWPRLKLDACAHLAQQNHTEFAALVKEASGPGGQRPITYRNSAGTEYTTPLEDILLHVAQHGMYHRGQVALLVRASGGTPLPTDYIVFTRRS